MKTISIKIKVITFVHKTTGETESFVFAHNQGTEDSFEGTVFGEAWNVTGFWKVQRDMKKAGHQEIVTEKGNRNSNRHPRLQGIT